MAKKNKKIILWTQQEEEALLKNVEKHVFNLNKAFSQTSKEIQRTPTACAARWYTKLSKDPNNPLFITVSEKHKIVNRKNGKGESCSKNIFQRILRLLGLIS